MARNNRSGRNTQRLTGANTDAAEVVAHQIIQDRLRNLAIIGATPLIAGTGAGIVNSLQGEEASISDNALLQTMGQATGYGALAAGAGALTVPGMRTAVGQERLNNDYFNMPSEERVRLGNLYADRRAANPNLTTRPALGGRAKTRAMTAAGVTAAGVGLANLIGSFRNENPSADNTGSNVAGGLTTGALLAAMGLTLMPDDDLTSRFPYDDDVDYGYGTDYPGGGPSGGGNDGNGGGGGDYPRTPQPGGGPAVRADRMLPASTVEAFNPRGLSNVVDVQARDAGILNEVAIRNGLNQQQTSALGRVMQRRR